MNVREKYPPRVSKLLRKQLSTTREYARRQRTLRHLGRRREEKP